MTTNLETLIKALEAGDYDSVLKGTKYDTFTDNHDLNSSRGWAQEDPEYESDWYEYECEKAREEQKQITDTDSVLNAARCIVLEAAVREAHEKFMAIVEYEKYIEDVNHEAGVLASMARDGIAATKKLVGA